MGEKQTSYWNGSAMRIFRLIGIGVVGAAIVVFLYAKFIMKWNHVTIEKDEAGILLYTVDDGLVFSDPESCAGHCRDRPEWNLQNTVDIRCQSGVSTSDVMQLESIMMRQQVYPRSLVRETGLLKTK
jgi:hypothetical protein